MIMEKMVDGPVDERISQALYTEAELLRNYGDHSLAFFGLAPENRHFLAPGGEGLVNYRLVNKVAVVLGDPVCAPEACERVTARFLDYCTRHHWHIAFYQASPAYLNSYSNLGLHSFKMGEEAILHPQTFTLKGSAMANVRTSARRAEREGVSIQWYDGALPEEAMQQLEHVSSAWLAQKTDGHPAEMGFSMGKLTDLTNIAARTEIIASTPANRSSTTIPRLVTGVVTTREGRACAFVTFTPIYGMLNAQIPETVNQLEDHGWGWSLDLMRRSPDAPPCVMELLLVRAIERFQSCGAQVVSLGLVAMSDTRQEMPSVQQQLTSFASHRLGMFEQRGSLFNFKQKFNPAWQSRYLLIDSRRALPQIALAVLSLRQYSGGKVVNLLTKRIGSSGK